MPGAHTFPVRSLLVVSLALVALLLGARQTLAQKPEEVPEGEAPEAEAPEAQDRPTLYWYCEECGLEMVCPPGSEHKQVKCPHCVHKGVTLGVYDYSHKDGASGTPLARLWGQLWFKLLLGATVVLLLCERVITRWQRGRQAGKKTARPAAGGRIEIGQWLQETDRIRPRKRGH